MRPIDADALLKAICSYPYGYRGMIKSEIENQPTVDAIPIEYIREHMNGFYDHGYNEFGSALEALIMDWEEENGTDNQF